MAAAKPYQQQIIWGKIFPLFFVKGERQLGAETVTYIFFLLEKKIVTLLAEMKIKAFLENRKSRVYFDGTFIWTLCNTLMDQLQLSSDIFAPGWMAKSPETSVNQM